MEIPVTTSNSSFLVVPAFAITIHKQVLSCVRYHVLVQVIGSGR